MDKHELSGFAIHLILTHSVELFSLCHPVDVNVVVWDGKSPVERWWNIINRQGWAHFTVKIEKFPPPKMREKDYSKPAKYLFYFTASLCSCVMKINKKCLARNILLCQMKCQNWNKLMQYCSHWIYLLHCAPGKNLNKCRLKILRTL